MPLLRSAIGRGSLRLTRVGVVVDVGVCAVSVAVLGETDSTAICQLRSQRYDENHRIGCCEHSYVTGRVTDKLLII